MIRYFLTTAIFRISVLGLALVSFSHAQSRLDAARTSGVSASDQANVINELTARIGEESFWTGIHLPTHNLHVIVFDGQNAKGNRGFDFDVLAIVPDINATYQYRLCGQRIIPVKRAEEWLAWRYPGATRISGEEYARHQVSHFDGFISHAKRSDDSC